MAGPRGGPGKAAGRAPRASLAAPTASWTEAARPDLCGNPPRMRGAATCVSLLAAMCRTPRRGREGGAPPGPKKGAGRAHWLPASGAAGATAGAAHGARSGLRGHLEIAVGDTHVVQVLYRVQHVRCHGRRVLRRGSPMTFCGGGGACRPRGRRGGVAVCGKK